MLRTVLLTFLYMATLAGANPTLADVSAAQAVLEGDMRKLVFAEAKDLPEVGLVDMDDAPKSLAEYRGRWVVLNFWATWCAPCRKEMPALDRLAGDAGETGPVVVTVATGRNPPAAIARFFDEIGVKNLPILRDPKSELARKMGVLGLPVTVILNPEGQEVARLIGDAEWDGEAARAMFAALLN